MLIRIALASSPIPESLGEGLNNLEDLVRDASSQQAAIICFPESYLPGYPGMGYSAEDQTIEALSSALNHVCEFALAKWEYSWQI